MKLKIIVGSIRPGRAADPVVAWVRAVAEQHPGFSDVEVLDLRDWRLPLFQENLETIGDFNDPTYSQPIVKRWNQTIASGDAFLFVTPEYNHSIPGVLKNAIDTVWLSGAFRNKPAGFVSYSYGLAAGTRAIEHLALIAIETEMVPLRNTVLLPRVPGSFGEDGKPVDTMAHVALDILLEDLDWWTRLLAQARSSAPAPGNSRIMDAMARG